MCVSLSMTRTVIRFVSMAFFFSTHILFSLSLDFQDKDIAIVYFFLNVSCLYVCMYVCVYRPQSFYHHQYLSVEKTTTRVTSSPFFSLSRCFCVFRHFFCLKFSFDAFLSTIRISSCSVVFENRVRLID